MNNWKLDPNPLDSVKKLIANTSVLNKDEGDTSKLPCIQLVENMELVVDSACECN